MHRILVVEDDASLRLLYEEELTEAGFEVTSVATGEDAVDAILGRSDAGFDAVVLDIRLGGMDGLETMRRILTDRPHTAVVLNSAYGGFRSDFASWAADAYVVKSSDLSELRNSLRDAIERRAVAAAP